MLTRKGLGPSRLDGLGDGGLLFTSMRREEAKNRLEEWDGRSSEEPAHSCPAAQPVSAAPGQAGHTGPPTDSAPQPLHGPAASDHAESTFTQCHWLVQPHCSPEAEHTDSP